MKLIPEHLITYKILGEPGGPHYAHYDLVGSRLVGVSLSFSLFDLFFLAHTHTHIYNATRHPVGISIRIVTKVCFSDKTENCHH